VSGTPTRAVVVDASVAVKWLLRDEADLAEADRLLDALSAGIVTLAAPAQIEVEVANAVRKAILNRRLHAADGQRLIAEWTDSFSRRLRLVPNAPLIASALSMSISLGVTLFDALYIVHAESVGADLVVADTRLLRSPAAALPFVRPLSGYALGDMG
jgi:predicted nucleic acid-binding protein